MSVAQKLLSTDVRLPLMLPKMVDRDSIVAASPRRIYSNAHAYHIHSISMNSDEETFLSADDLRVNLWNVQDAEQSFSNGIPLVISSCIYCLIDVVDMKPASIEELTEVITTAHFHPLHCNLFAFGTSKGYVKLCDMRSAALCDRYAKVFRREEGSSDAAGSHSFFSELISSISDLAFSPDGRQFVTRDYMQLKVWDLAMETRPVLTIAVHEAIKPKLCDLYENDSIFDKFECGFTYDGSQVMSGSYSNLLRFTSLKDSLSEYIQADKSIFKSSKRNSRSKLVMPGSGRSASIGRLDDPAMAGELDFDRKILYSSLHPGENTVAVAALSNLFIFSQVSPPSTSP